jgi:ligand-binding sensor domain-containing protein
MRKTFLYFLLDPKRSVFKKNIYLPVKKNKWNLDPRNWCAGIITGLLFLCILNAVSAQRYPFTTITNKDGLPQSSVFKTMQDHQGYIWMATEAGLTRYDGYQFKNYSYYSGLNANFIFDIEFDAQGRLWIGSFGTGVAVFNGNDFYVFNHTNGFPANFTTDLFFSSSGEMWVASKDQGVIRITMDYEPHIYRFIETGAGFYAQKIDELPNGDVVVCGNKGVFVYKKENNYHPVKINSTRSNAIYVDEMGGIWTGGRGTIQYIKNDTAIDRSYLLPYPVNILSISEPEKNGMIYIATENGLLKINGEQRTWLTSVNGLSYDLVKDVIKDDFGNIWVSTYGNGATILNDRGMTHYDTDGEGGDLCAFSIGEEKNGTIWIGKYFGGFFEVTDSSFKKTELAIPPNANPLTSCTDKEGNVYLNANNETIFKIKDGKIDWQFHNPFVHEPVYGVLKLNDGNVLTCGSYGCIIINEETSAYATIKSTENKFMKDPFYDEYGNIWMMGELGEVYKLSGEKLTDYTQELNPEKASITHGMYDEIRHAWWFTKANGVLIWDGKNKLQLNSGNVLKSDLSFSVAMDKNGDVWIGQVQGLEFIHMQSRQITHVGYDQGFTPVETNAGAVFTDSKGNVWFGTLTSATKVMVDEIGKDSTTGILRLQEIEVNGKLFYKESYNDTVYPALEVGHNQNNFDFQFASLCYTNAKDVQYSWKMEGVDNDWITKVNTREVNYSNLRPGEYTFMVKAKNPNGFLTNQVNIKILVLKPFWNTAGFYFFEALVFLFIVFLSFRFTRQASNNRLGQIMTLLSIFIIFESLMLYISGYIDQFTSGIPVFQLVMNVILAASLHPLEQRIQKFMRRWARTNKKTIPK